MIEKVHGLKNIAYTITYIDPEGDLLPINNDDNLAKALSTARPLLRLVILRKGRFYLTGGDLFEPLFDFKGILF